jgi:hypothetical protein
VPKSPGRIGSVIAVGGRFTFNKHKSSVRPRIARRRWEEIYETSPPKFSASGRGRCRAAGGVADGEGASVADEPAGAMPPAFGRPPLHDREKSKPLIHNTNFLSVLSAQGPIGQNTHIQVGKMTTSGGQNDHIQVDKMSTKLLI